MLRSKIQPTCTHSTIIDSAHQDFLFKTPTFYHHWCYVPRFLKKTIFQQKQVMLQFNFFLKTRWTRTGDKSKEIDPQK